MEDVKSKRGRKPKQLNESSNQHGVLVKQPDQSVKKRGRKPKTVYSSLAQPDDTNAVLATSDDENIVMKLSIKDNVPVSIGMLTSESLLPPHAYDYQELNYMSFEQELGMVDENENNEKFADKGCDHHTSITNKNKNCKLKVIELLKDFEEKNKNNEWPQSTSIHCYWCCHKFSTPPLGIPLKYTNDKFHVYGCYCSLECAAAFNMSSKESLDEIFERYNMINLLSRMIGYKNVVRCAPNRLALKMFGGHLDIDEFRAYSNTSKLININFPPMMTMTQQIEEINESDITNDYKYIPVDTERINKYKEKIKLRRSKPVTNFENTLDHAMNLKFGL